MLFPYRYPRPRRGGPGCLSGLFLLVAAAFVCGLLVANGTLVALWENTPLVNIPLLSAHGLALAEPLQASSSVLGQPTLSAAFVDRVLSAYHSPAVSTGQALSDLSLRSGIDDAYALAFFMHESTFGTAGVARATRSLGNIRCTPGYVCIEGYRAYATWPAGYADWFSLIRCGYVGACAHADLVSSRCPCVTVEQILPVYAPAADGNDVQGYIAAVRSAVAAWRDGRVLV